MRDGRRLNRRGGFVTYVTQCFEYGIAEGKVTECRAVARGLIGRGGQGKPRTSRASDWERRASVRLIGAPVASILDLDSHVMGGIAEFWTAMQIVTNDGTPTRRLAGKWSRNAGPV